MANWVSRTPCKGLTDLFFPPESVDGGKGQKTKAIMDQAKAICEPCPYKNPCLERGLNQRWGIWGGTNERERRAI